MRLLFQIKSWLTYWLDAVDRHSLHSPFFYDFYTRVVRADRKLPEFEPFEERRRALLKDRTMIDVLDLGAGPSYNVMPKRRISDIAGTSLTPPRFSRLYAAIAAYAGAEHIIELGTSLGINTLYLASQKNSVVTTFEGSPSIATIARDTFNFAGAKNITLVEGDITKTLPGFLQRAPKPNLVFMDANHRYEPTILYFETLIQRVKPSTIIIADDIHYSEDMQKAWNVMRNHPLVYGSADLYRAGLLFFDPSLNKQHVVLQF
jgi:precorrin-6B methylase 2